MAKRLPAKLRSALEHALRTGDPARVRPHHATLTAAPDTPAAALYRLAMMEMAAGDPPTALGLIAAAAKRAPQDPTIRVNHAQILLAVGRTGESVERLETLTPSVRANPAVTKLYADALLAAGRADRAAEVYDGILRGGAADPGVLTNHGVALRRLGRFDEAARQLRRAIAVAPNREAVVNLAGLFLQLELPEEAIRVLRDFVDRNPMDPVLHHHLAVAYRADGDPDLADRAIRHALVQAPAASQTWGLAAESAQNRADLVGAARWARRTLICDPASVLGRQVAVAVERRSDRAAEAVALADGWIATTPAESRHALLFEKAQALESLGDRRGAFDAFDAANAIQRETAFPSRDAARALDQVARLAAFYSTTPPARFRTGGDLGDDLLFVVGFPRSGTTLLDQILDAHPDITVIEERPLVAAMVAELSTSEPGYPDALAGLDDQRASDLAVSYRRRLARRAGPGGARYTVDKMPLNLVHVGLIRSVFPAARFILALRHPCDVVLSCFMQNFRLNDWMAAFSSLDGAAEMYAAVFDAWNRYVERVETPYLSVRYEDVVENLEREARRLLAFLDLAFDDRVLAFHEHARTRGVLATPSAAQVTRPIYRTAVARWRRYDFALASVRDRLAPEIERFGYAEEAD